jgi:hypothetical protein
MEFDGCLVLKKDKAYAMIYLCFLSNPRKLLKFYAIVTLLCILKDYIRFLYRLLSILFPPRSGHINNKEKLVKELLNQVGNY